MEDHTVTSPLWDLDIKTLSKSLLKKEIRPKEVVESLLKRISEVEPSIKAYITITPDEAFRGAEIAERLIMEGKATPLTGIPFAIKDNICTKGIRTTCASRILENFIPPYESTVTERLRSSGYVLIGKTNMDEFAMGSSTENSAFYPTKNPWDLTRAPGGSSGGSAAATAAGLTIASLGSDTGGSIRQPASFCGVVGLKPTYGSVSRFGLVAFASSLDQIGPITKTVWDAAIVMNVISGHDPKDSTSVPDSYFGISRDYTSQLGKEIKGLKIGLPEEYFIEGIDKEVKEAVLLAVKHLNSLGAEVINLSLPYTSYAVATYYILATSEASSNLARYDGVKYGLRVKGHDLLEMYRKTRSQGFGDEVKRRIMLGTYALSSGYYEAYYKKAQQVRTLIKRDFEEAFKKVDLIITPTSPTPAFRLGERISDPLQMYLSDIFTISVNLAGLPAISIPCGFTKDNLPIGLQIIGKPFDEPTILRVAHAYEESTEWHKRRPLPFL